MEIESDGAGHVVKLRGQGEVLNFATIDLLGFLKDKRGETAALDVMRNYGCGGCGPRVFYCKTKIHLECEAALEQFCVPSFAIHYSFGATTASSTIIAFVRRCDLLVVDDAITYPLRPGTSLSRARAMPFKNNDMTDRRRVLQKVVDKNDHLATQSHPVVQYQRGLIMVGGIAAPVANVFKLQEVVRLKNQFRFRLLVDKSLSLGVLQHSDRGSLRENNVQRSDVEFSTVDLGNGFGTVGGVCVVQDVVIEHQRISNVSYCFSASQPPFLAKAVTTAVQTLTK